MGTAIASGVVAVLGNALRLGVIDLGVAEHIATFAGCFTIGLGCAVLGKIFGLEKIIMTVPTLLVSIPGSAALRSLLHIDQNRPDLALSQGTTALFGVIAMVAGLSAARMLTDPDGPSPAMIRRTCERWSRGYGTGDETSRDAGRGTRRARSGRR